MVNRDFARLWYGQAVSTVGDFMFDTTLTIWIARVLLGGSRWAPAAVSGLMLCALVAIIGVGPVAGVFVDRWSRRRIMLATEVIRGLLVGLLTMIMLLPRRDLPVGVWLGIVYVVVFMVNAAGQFFNPARFATIGDIVPGDVDRGRAFGIGQATNATAAIIGPPLAAPLLIAVGVQWALVFNAVSYGVSFLAVRSVRFPARTIIDGGDEAANKPGWRTEFTAGLRMFAGSRFLTTLLTIAVVAQLGTGAMNALDIFFLTDNLHAAPNLLGVMSMAIGLGSIVGALLAARIVRLISARNLMWSGLIVGGSLFALYARQASFAPALVMAFLFIMPVAAMNTGISPLLLSATPPGFTGRMMAVFNPIIMVASMISVIVAGSLASTTLRDFHANIVGLHVGRIDTIFTVAALLVIGAGIYGAFALPPAGTEATRTRPPDEADPDRAAGGSTSALPSPRAPMATVDGIDLVPNPPADRG